MSNDRVALVTGAGSGIGRATAVMLARAGHRLVLAGRRGGPLRETAAMCGPGTEAVEADIGDAGQVRGLIEGIASRHGRLDALVNNAGVGTVLSIEATTPAALEEVFRVNALGAAQAIHFAWPLWKRMHGQLGARMRATIVNVSSMAAVDPFPGFFAYGASKAAMNLLAASAAKEGAAIGVRAFAVAPGATETAMLRSAFDESVLPREATMAPEAVSRVIASCIAGERDRDNGRAILVLPGAMKEWWAMWKQDRAGEEPVWG